MQDRQLLRLQLLSLYEQRLTRIYQSTLKQLRQIQTERRALLKIELETAGRIRALLRSQQIPFHPTEFGFVSSAGQFDNAIRHQEAMSGDRMPARGVYHAPDLPHNAA